MSDTMTTAKVTLKEIKDVDAWQQLIDGLGISRSKAGKLFEHGEYASIEIEVDQNMKIVGGRILPVKR